MIYIALLAVLVFFIAFFSWVLSPIFLKQKAIDKLKYYDEHYQQRERIESTRKEKKGVFAAIASVLPRVSFSKKKAKLLERRLLQADLPLTADEVLVIRNLFSFALSFLAYSLTKDIFASLLTFFLIWLSPNFFIKRAIKKRVKAFDDQINDGIVLISNSLKAGYSFLQSVAVVVEETEDPFAKEFRQLLKEMSFGISSQEALKNMLDRMDSDDLRLLVNAILIQMDIGGNLSEILENISITIRERQKIYQELKTLTAQGRLSGIIIVLLPILLGLILFFLNREYMMLLFTTLPGLGMVAYAVVSQLIGIFMIKKIVDIKM